jgi:hypothetical protein
MSKYYIGDKGFKTKKDCENYTREIITNLGCCDVKEDNNKYSFFLDLINNHPEYIEKKGTGIKYFFIQPNPLNKKTYQTMIKRTDNSDIDFSWLYCCSFKPKTIKEDLNIAMRRTIYPFVSAFKRDMYIRHGKIQCYLCEIDNEDEDYQVDHDDPPFRELRDNFIKHTKILIPQTFGSCPKYKLNIFKPEDNEFEKAWSKYHNDNCLLQILCKKCNLKKH